MKKRLFKNFLMAAAVIASLFVGVQTTSNHNSIAGAEAVSTDVNYVDVNTSSMQANESTIRQVANYNNEGNEWTDKSLVRYYYHIGDTEVTGDKNSVSVKDGDKLGYKIERQTASRTSLLKKWTWSNVELVEEGECTVRLFSNVTITMNDDALGTEAQFPIVTGYFKSDKEGSYKVGVNGEIVLGLDNDYEDFYITINEEIVEKDTYTITEINSDIDLEVKYVKATDSKLLFDANTLQLIKSKAITLTINDVAFSGEKDYESVAEKSEIKIVVTPNNKHKIDLISCNGSDLNNEESYPNYGFSFVAGTKVDYNISVIASDATNTISCANGEGEVKIDGQWAPQSLNSVLPRDTKVTVTLEPAEDEFITDFNISNVDDMKYVYDNGQVKIEFTTGVSQEYVVEFTTKKIFEAKENDVEINIYDVLLMHEGNEEYKNVTYQTLFNDVFVNNTENLTVDDVKFEYLAGTYPITDDLNWEFYFPIEKTSATNKEELTEYVKERYGKLLSLAVTDEVASKIIPILHKFGTLEEGSEVVKIIYDGSDRYQRTEIVGNVKTVDQREKVEIDINEEIHVVYGSYANDVCIKEFMLDGRLGVIASDETKNLNDELSISESMVGKDVGSYTISVTFNPNNYFYKADTKALTVIVDKADATVEIANNVINYELIENGTVNKDYIVNIESNVVLNDKNVDNAYFVVGLDIVDGEFIAKLDLSNLMSSNSDGWLGDMVDGGIDKAIELAIKYADPEGDGLTLVEFVEFINNLSGELNKENAELDISYMDKITEILTQVSQTLDVRIFVINDGSDITPKQHGAYIVGAVTTDSNYNTAYDFGYLVITAEILDVKFVENDVENSLRKFEFDGTEKAMSAVAYEIDSQIASGNMKYYYVGIQTDGTFYTNAVAPVNAGTYSVFAIFNNAKEGGLPSKVGLGVGAMVIIPSNKAEVKVNNAVHTYNGESFDITSMVTVNKDDASLAYVTASINVNGDFSEEGFSALDGSVNIDFPARFDTLLQKYFPEEFEAGVNVDTFISLLNKAKTSIEASGYTVEFIDSIVSMLEEMPNLVTVTFNNVEDINSSSIGAYLVGAIVFDPNYLPKANLGVLVIQPQASVSTLVWNYNDSNKIITLPALSVIDMNASVVENENITVNYVYFGIAENGKLTKVTDIKDLTSGIWMQVAYINEEISANITFAKPIARIFIVTPQNVNIVIEENTNYIVREYNAKSQAVTATATYEDGTIANAENLTITYVGADNLGNRYYSNQAPVNAGVYSVIVSYVQTNNDTVNYAGFAFAELVITLAQTEIEAGDKVVCFNGNEHNIDFVVKEGFNYITIVENNGKLNIVLPSSWNIILGDDFDSVNIISILENYLAKDYIDEIRTIIKKYEVEDVVVNAALPTEIGEYSISIVAVNPNYKVAVAKNTLIIKDHNLTAHAGKTATCTEFGWNEYYTCADCDYTTYAKIEALGHKEVIDEAVAATCTTKGLTEGRHCSVCGEVFVAQEDIEKLTHKPSGWKTAIVANCSTKGLRYKECTMCHEVLETKETPISHNLVLNPAKAPTCTEVGWNKHYTCKDCGLTTYCEIDALGHTEVVDHKVEPTCTTTGLTEGAHCSVCGEVFVAQETIAKIEHIFGEWHITLPATATNDGYAVRICVLCSHDETRVILAYGDQEIGNIEVEVGNDGKVIIDENSIQDAIKDVKETDCKEIVITTNNTQKELSNVEITKSSLQQIIESGSALTIEASNIHATFDKDALTTIVTSANGEANIQFDLRMVNDEQLNTQQKEALVNVKVAGIISAQILCGDEIISNFGVGTVEVKIPFEIPEGKMAADYKIMYIADDGSIEELITEYADGKLIVEMSHFSEYVIVDLSQDKDSNFPLIVVAISFGVVLMITGVSAISVYIKNRRSRRLINF